MRRPGAGEEGGHVLRAHAIDAGRFHCGCCPCRSPAPECLPRPRLPHRAPAESSGAQSRSMRSRRRGSCRARGAAAPGSRTASARALAQIGQRVLRERIGVGAERLHDAGTCDCEKCVSMSGVCRCEHGRWRRLRLAFTGGHGLGRALDRCRPTLPRAWASWHCRRRHRRARVRWHHPHRSRVAGERENSPTWPGQRERNQPPPTSGRGRCWFQAWPPAVLGDHRSDAPCASPMPPPMVMPSINAMVGFG